MVHNKTTHNVKYYSLYASKQRTPSSHNICRSSIKGAKYVLISYPDCFGPDIIIVNIKYFLLIHSHGGRLYIVVITSQQLYVVDKSSNGLVPSVDKPKQKFIGSNPKVGKLWSINLHDGVLAGCLKIQSTFLSSHANASS